MAKNALDDYSTTAASNTDIDGLDSTGATGLVKSGDNYARSIMAHAKAKVLDFGAVNTVAGTGDAITVTLASNTTALYDGMRFSINAPGTNTTIVTIAVSNSGATLLGTKKVRKWSGGAETALSAGDITSGHILNLVYDSARDGGSGAFMIDGSASVAAATTSAAGIVELATQTEAATMTDTSRAITADGLFFLGGYTTTATAAGTTTLTVTSTYNQYFTGTTTQTLVLPVTSTLVLGRSYRVVNNSTGAVTVQSSGANTILILAAGASAIFTCILTSGTDAASWSHRPLGITLGTAVASTSGTSIDFTGIPAWAKRITIMFDGVSTSGTSPPQIQIGDSGGVETSGYLGASTAVTNTSVQSAIFTAGYGIGVNTSFWAAAVVVSGSITLSLMNASTNTWVADGSVGRSDTGSTTYFTSGGKSLSATLDRVRITTAGGTDTFDAGSINIMWE